MASDCSARDRQPVLRKPQLTTSSFDLDRLLQTTELSQLLRIVHV
jgi:hypothetical protein